MARYLTQAFIAAFISMVMIYLIKRVAQDFNVPIVKDISQEVFN